MPESAKVAESPDDSPGPDRPRAQAPKSAASAGHQRHRRPANLLALNAAIEDRPGGEAGEASRGRDEVRKLAEKTMTATKEVEESIGRIQEGSRQAVSSMRETERQVAAGTEATDKAGTSLEQIIQSILDMTGQVAQIATAAEQQSSAAEEINHSIEEEIAHRGRPRPKRGHPDGPGTRELAILSQDS